VKVEGLTALITGGASGLGAGAARVLSAAGVRCALLDRNLDLARELAAELGGIALGCDVVDGPGVAAAIAAVSAQLGTPRIVLNAAGIDVAIRTAGAKGAHPLEEFERVIRVNLTGTFNVARLAAQAMLALPPLNEDGERGVIVNIASVVAQDGPIGQVAYAASKAGVQGMTLPMARDLAQHGIRVCTIAPGLFATPLMKQLPEPVQQSLAASIPFPPRLGKPEEFAQLACHIVTNTHLNGEVIRLDGALRMAPR